MPALYGPSLPRLCTDCDQQIKSLGLPEDIVKEFFEPLKEIYLTGRRVGVNAVLTSKER
jgi:hypothetical protein